MESGLAPRCHRAARVEPQPSDRFAARTCLPLSSTSCCLFPAGEGGEWAAKTSMLHRLVAVPEAGQLAGGKWRGVLAAVLSHPSPVGERRSTGREGEHARAVLFCFPG